MKTWYKNKRVFNKDNTVQIFKTAPSLFKATKCSKAKNTDLNETIQMNSNFERETDSQRGFHITGVNVNRGYALGL